MSNHGTLILIQGLAGSGKSHLIRFLKFDFMIEENFAISDQAEDENISILAKELRGGRYCIVSERKYRSTHKRNEFIEKLRRRVRPAPAPNIESIFFENDLDAANHNCQHRTNKANDPGGQRHIIQNKKDAEDYQIPDDAIVVKIYRIPSQ